MGNKRKTNRVTYLLLSIAILAVGFAGVSFQNSSPIKPKTVEQFTKEIAFVADTQAPLWIETLYLASNHNELATELLFNEINDRHPLSFFILGDIVGLSYSNSSWKRMDLYLHTCESNGIPVHACLGNHEYIGEGRKGEMNFQKRFPDHVNTGYVKVEDSIAVVLLNSNFGSMQVADTAKQSRWYIHTMDSLDHAPNIEFIVVGCHHSPYSNSKIVGSSVEVQKRFVPPFIHSKKAKLFVSGHSHNFEYFHREGKDFVVVGGGGGLHQPMVKPSNRIPDEAKGYNPMFHYLTIKRDGGHLMVCSHRLKEDFSGYAEGLNFVIN